MKTIMIIGATSAIATACARLWAGQGGRLFLVGRDAGKLTDIAADLRARGAADVRTHVMDATDIAAHPAMMQAAMAAWGALDVGLIAHGSLPDQAACEADPALAVAEFATNGTATIALLLLLARHFDAQRRGAIGVITSVAGDRGRPSNYLYGSAKAAVSTLCEGLRPRLFKAGVTLTDIRPGFVATPMTDGLPLPGLLVAQPETVATIIVAAIGRGRDVVYAPGFWAPIMLIVRSLPRFIFKRMTL